MREQMREPFGAIRDSRIAMQGVYLVGDLAAGELRKLKAGNGEAGTRHRPAVRDYGVAGGLHFEKMDVNLESWESAP